VKIGPSHYKSGGVSLNYVHYEYTTPDGRTHLGKSPPLLPKETSHWVKNDQTTVCYDPSRPHESVWIELWLKPRQSG
jgi:hypothetical protein